MCGIIGHFGKDAFTQVCQGLAVLQERGRDGAGVYDGEKTAYASSPAGLPLTDSPAVIGHVLHAIVHTLPQPLTGKGALSVNGEIYNWKELAREHSLSARNDAELLLLLLDRYGVEETIAMLRGVYAFAYWRGGRVFLARDLLGVKPLWYTFDHGFSFASEQKALPSGVGIELNPRTILCYDPARRSASFSSRRFFPLLPTIEETKGTLAGLKRLLSDAVRIRIPERPFGLLLSGGVDSAIVALLLKKSGKPFTCYTAATSEDAPDLLGARTLAKELGLPLREAILSEEETARLTAEVVPLIEDANVIKAGVALPLAAAAKLAQKDGVKVMFSGTGADELFAGYARYRASAPDQLNKDCYSNLLWLYERNTYRDDVITMHHNLELRVPFLDKEVAAHALRLSPSLKIREGTDKWILRQLARSLGLPPGFAMAKKRAAQYGSGFDKAVGRLAKREGLSKSAYLSRFLSRPNLRLAALLSSGKDGMYAAYTMARQNYELTCAVTLRSANADSFMFHTPNVDLVRLQAEAMGIPLLVQETAGEKEAELSDLAAVLSHAKKFHRVDGVVTGALYSNYQRERIEQVCDSLGLKVFSPLWHIDQEQEVRAILHEGFSVLLSRVAAEGLDASWVGRPLSDSDVDRLVALKEKVGLNVAGEGGEYESLVLDCPLFSKRISLDKASVVKDGMVATYRIERAHLEEKGNS